MKDLSTNWMPLLVPLIFWACIDHSNTNKPPEEVEGYRPIYANADDVATEIKSMAPQSLEHPGKIYVYGTYLFVSEIGQGVHIFDNTNPENPIVIRFINIPGNGDIAFQGTTLYANHYDDMVSIDLSNPVEAKVLSRTPNVLDLNSLPPQDMYYFECVDEKKGKVIGWELTTINRPKCRS